MARYGRSYYGSNPVSDEVTYYGELVENEFDATPFTVVSNGYGKALASWRRPGGAIGAQRLLRNPNGVPLHETDGTTVLEEIVPDDADITLSRVYQDIDLTHGRFYYYALFVFDATELIWRRAGYGEALVAKDWGYTDRLFQRLPEVFKSADYNNLDQSLIADEDSFLYRYLSIFGFQLDHIRTEYDSLRKALDALSVSNDLLPALGQQVGFPYEPELGARSMRRLVANAVHLWSTKGTLPGIRDLASLVMGYPASVRIGYNLALDDLDAGPKGGQGRWRSLRSNATVTYKANTLTGAGPAGTGVFVIDCLTTGDVELGMNTASNEPPQRLRVAVPVVEGQSYIVSEYFRTVADGITAQMGIQWLDNKGRVLLADPVYDTAVSIDDSWSGRPNTMVVAPPAARYIESTVLITGMQAGDQVRGCGFMVQEDTTLKPWQCSREILIFLEAELINHVGNTSGEGGAEGWSEGVSATTFTDGTPYLTFAPQDENAGTVELAEPDELFVTVPGDPPPTATAGGLANGIAVYEGDVQDVLAGEEWTSLAEVTTSVETGPQTPRIGFATYSGPEFVGYVWGERVLVDSTSWTELRATLTVPSDLSYDRVALALDFTDAEEATTYGFRHAALEQAGDDEAFFFEGATPSPTGDYLWEGVPYRSPSHFYPRRSPRARRLRELLVDYAPFQACYALAFAQALIPADPLAVDGSDVDPSAAPPPPPSGRSIRLRHNDLVTVAADAELKWDVGSMTAGNEVSLVFGTTTPVGRQFGMLYNVAFYNEAVGAEVEIKWGGVEPVGASVELVWNTYVTAGQHVSALWGLDEEVELEEGLPVEAAYQDDFARADGPLGGSVLPVRPEGSTATWTSTGSIAGGRVEAPLSTGFNSSFDTGFLTGPLTSTVIGRGQDGTALSALGRGTSPATAVAAVYVPNAAGGGNIQIRDNTTVLDGATTSLSTVGFPVNSDCSVSLMLGGTGAGTTAYAVITNLTTDATVTTPTVSTLNAHSSSSAGFRCLSAATGLTSAAAYAADPS